MAVGWAWLDFSALLAEWAKSKTPDQIAAAHALLDSLPLTHWPTLPGNQLRGSDEIRDREAQSDGIRVVFTATPRAPIGILDLVALEFV